jgi:hypothetical protein
MARKTSYESKVERTTWFLMMVTFLALANWQIPGEWICIAISFILLCSGIYQYRKGWVISPVTWVVCALGGAAGSYGLYFDSVIVDLTLVGLGMIFIVIGWGTLTNEG